MMQCSHLLSVVLSICFGVGLIVSPAYAQNYVLSLDGDGDYLEIADSAVLNNIGWQVTIEAWINVSEFTNTYIPIIYKGDRRPQGADRSQGRNRSYTLWLTANGAVQLNVTPNGEPRIFMSSPSGLIHQGKWYHVAGVVDTFEGVMKILINGVEVASGTFPRTAVWKSELPLRIGWTHEEGDELYATFAGQIDEVRIWRVARTAPQIGAAMFTPLHGNEPGLVGYWRFEGEGGRAIDATGNEGYGRFIGEAARLPSKLPAHVQQPIALSGVVHNDVGTPTTGVDVRLQRGAEVIEETQTDANGHYHILTFREGTFDLYATLKGAGDLRGDVRLHSGEHRTLNLMLRPASRIEGTLFMLDDVTAHVAVPVQAVQRRKPSSSAEEGREGQHKGEPIIVSATLSDAAGKYRFVNLKPGAYQVRCYTSRGYVYYEGSAAGARHRPEIGPWV